MITKIGDLIDRVTRSVREYGISPQSEIVVRVGDFGQEMPIHHLKVQGGVNSKLVIQVQAPQ